MDFSTIKVFQDDQGKDVTFDSVLKDIYKTSKEKKVVIQTIIDNMAGKIENSTDSAMMGPVIAEFIEVSLKNDDQLVKLAQIVQRAVSKMPADPQANSLLTPEETLELKQLALRAEEDTDEGSSKTYRLEA